MKAIGAFSTGGGHLTNDLVARIEAAYRASTDVDTEKLSAGWEFIVSKSSDIQDNIALYLDDPGKTNMFYGFDGLMKDFLDPFKADAKEQNRHIAKLRQVLTALAESMGIQRVRNPEGGTAFPRVPNLEDLLSLVDKRVGVIVKFPNPFPDEFGLVSSRGIISLRAIHAIYQAWRVKQLADLNGGNVIEIGAGLGRTAYYAVSFGITSYTLIDLPLTNVSQANFLGRVLGFENICLFNEPYNGQTVRILPSSALKSSEENFDVFLNVDSLTEMSVASAEFYGDYFMHHGKVFMSVNHEANADVVHLTRPFINRSTGRWPYWLREGYVEELFAAEPPPPPPPLRERSAIRRIWDSIAMKP